MDKLPLGALPEKDGVRFRVWAPTIQRMDLALESSGQTLALDSGEGGFYEKFVREARPGDLYRYRLNEEHIFPDPASRFQPQGVHGPSMVVDPTQYQWSDGDWQGIPQKDLVFYELHVGTFSPEGTFAGVKDRLSYLKDLGITAIELMPVADFPGRWGWGYDHAALFAPSRAYGSPDDLRDLVDAAHQAGLAVFLDVIYNHLGPDGAYVAAFAPMFTEHHHTPWGPAINLDDIHSEGVRHFFIENALHWLREYHIDGLRLDATNALVDDSETHFLAELADHVNALESGPHRILIAEDPRNMTRLISPRDQGGYGLDGLWADDFHHQIRNMTAGDSDGYYASYAGSDMNKVAETLRQGWFFDGRFDPVMGSKRGTDPSGIRLDQCVICIQNHDQIGNRPHGNRLHQDISLPVYRAVSALLLFAPELPLLFMGQEWAADTPFQFFSDHHAELGVLVSAGRKEEFKHFVGFGGEVPDPQEPETFYRSKLNWDELKASIHANTRNLYRDMLRLRRELEPGVEVAAAGEKDLVVKRGRYELLVTVAESHTLPLAEGAEVILHTEMAQYAGNGQAPEVRSGQIFFPQPGAMVVRTP